MSLATLRSLLQGVDADLYVGYPATGAQVPYVVLRPSITIPEVALSGDAIDWDQQWSAYAVGGSVEACHNLAVLVVQRLQGARVAGAVLSCTIGYNGAQIEGRYEAQITIQAYQGALL